RVVDCVGDQVMPEMEGLDTFDPFGAPDYELPAVDVEEDPPVQLRAAMRDAPYFEIRGDHAIDSAIDLCKALRKIIPNAAEDALHVLVQPALDKTRRAAPPILDRATPCVYFVPQPLELVDELLLRARLLVDPLQLALDCDSKRTGNRLGCVCGRLV